MNENEEIERLAKELYKKYKPAFDLVFKYASPSLSTFIPHNLVDLIKNEKTIIPFYTSNRYVRFQPKFLYENLDKLKEKGFLDQKDDLSGSWIFLFEFHVTTTFINFDMKIGPYRDKSYDSSCREELYKLFLEHKKYLNKVERPSGRLINWHPVFQKKIVTKTEYNKFLESGDDNLDGKIEKRFRELINKDLPKIQKIIEDALT